ncbi:MAG: MoxR family ATPase, partial [Planctomycetes bacterium]|nr:MoxR family ATPase [Planctomycetota bacterium]
GPIFANCLLCDEINRTPPRTQSAVLELMEERQVTVFGETRKLPEPFFVIATQNPLEQEGVYPLAEAQVDRFLFKVMVDLPPEEHEIAIVEHVLSGRKAKAEPVVDPTRFLAVQRAAAEVFVHRDLVQFAVRLCRQVSKSAMVRGPLGPRATLSMVRAAQARAALSGRQWISPHDVGYVFLPAARHRVHLTPDAVYGEVTADSVLEEAREAVPMPRKPGSNPEWNG